MKNLYFLIMGLCSLGLTGCATHNVEVTYYSDPEYAVVVCEKHVQGQTPLKLYYKIPDEDLKAGEAKLAPCYAVWQSGERRQYSSKIFFTPPDNLSLMLGAVKYRFDKYAQHTRNKKYKEAQAYADVRNQEITQIRAYQEAQRAKSRRDMAEALGGLNATLQQVNQSQQRQAQQGVGIVNTVPPGGYTFTPMQSPGPGSVDVYHVQRINDNLYNVKQVR